MITRFDRLMTDLPPTKDPSPNAAAAVQELLGGKFGEMSTLMNYTFQSFNFRGRGEKRPFYDRSGPNRFGSADARRVRQPDFWQRHQGRHQAS